MSNPFFPSSSPQNSPRVHIHGEESSSSSSNPVVEIQDMHTQNMNMLYQEMVRLRQELDQVRNSQVSSIPVSASSNLNNVPGSNIPQLAKPPKPDCFTGDRSSNVDSWIGSMERYFTASGIDKENVLSPEQKLRQMNHAIAFLRGTAGQWWASVMREGAANPSTLPSSWSQFKVMLLERYRPIAASKIARAKLDLIKQIGNVDGYCNAFLNQMQFIDDMSDGDKLHRFTSGLRGEIKMEVLRNEPTSLHEAMIKAEAAEKFLHTVSSSSFRFSNSKFKQRSYPSSSTYNYPRQFNRIPFPSSNSSFSSSTSVPMELGNIYSGVNEYDSIYRNGNSNELQQINNQNYNVNIDRNGNGMNYNEEELKNVNMGSNYNFNRNGNSNNNSNNNNNGNGNGRRNLSPQELERLKREGKCFYCEKPGHNSRFCNERKRSMNQPKN